MIIKVLAGMAWLALLPAALVVEVVDNYKGVGAERDPRDEA